MKNTLYLSNMDNIELLEQDGMRLPGADENTKAREASTNAPRTPLLTPPKIESILEKQAAALMKIMV